MGEAQAVAALERTPPFRAAVLVGTQLLAQMVLQDLSALLGLVTAVAAVVVHSMRTAALAAQDTSAAAVAAAAALK